MGSGKLLCTFRQPGGSLPRDQRTLAQECAVFKRNVWLLSNFANQIYFRLTMRGEISTQVEAILGVLTGVLDIFAAILAIIVVWEIYKQQNANSKLIPSQDMNAQPPPPPEFA